MKTFFKEIEIESKKRFDFVKLDEKIGEIIRESKIKEGILLLLCPHTTASILINEDDSTIHRDFPKIAEILIPEDLPYEHTLEGKINARAHQLAMIFGNSIFAPIKNGKLNLGTWQSIFLVEFLEPRKRKVFFLILGT